MTTEISQLEVHRPALTGHCYRMLGSVVDADDAAQETMIRAWKSLDKFDGRAALRTWLYRIATNVCLDEPVDRKRRERPMEEGLPSQATPPLDALVQRPRDHWIEPIADARAIPADADPSQRAILRQSIRLAFVAASQNLAPKQRAVLLLIEVLGWSAAEVAETLDTSVAGVNSALQRARATLADRRDNTPTALSSSQEQMLQRYVEAFALRHRSARNASSGRCDVVDAPLRAMDSGASGDPNLDAGSGMRCRGSCLVPTAACGWPAFGQYRASPDGGHKPWALIVLELSGNQITSVNSFLDTETLFPRFDLPMELPA